MDWTKIISELAERGVTQKAMAERCGCGQSTISEISRGEIKNPAYSIGKALIDYHAEAVDLVDHTQQKKAA